MVGPGRFFAGGFASAVQNVRTRILDREINKPGLEVLLDQYVPHLAAGAAATTLLELVFNGRTIVAETHPLTAAARYLSLPFYRIEGIGRLEVYFTQPGATIGGACNVTGRYVHAGTFPLEG